MKKTSFRGKTMRIGKFVLGFCVLVLARVSVVIAAAPVVTFKFKDIIVTGAHATYANGINDAGVIVGAYIDSVETWHGMALHGSKVTTIDHPNSSATACYGINSSAVIVGSYTTPSGVITGFEFSAGTFTDVRPPASLTSTATGINDDGKIVGYFLDSAEFEHGFVFDGHKKYTQIDAPGGDFVTQAWGINNDDHITLSASSGLRADSFLLIGKKFTKLSDPNEGKYGTIVGSINNRGEIVGFYIDDTGFHTHGWLLSKGAYYTVDDPKAATTSVSGINDELRIVGTYETSSGGPTGFEAIPKK
jgi:probable HAF family extracellular repeat protein